VEETLHHKKLFLRFLSHLGGVEANQSDAIVNTKFLSHLGGVEGSSSTVLASSLFLSHLGGVEEEL